MTTHNEPKQDGRTSDHDPEETALGRLNGPAVPSKKKSQKPTDAVEQKEKDAKTSEETTARSPSGKVVNTDEQRFATNRDEINADSVAAPDGKS